MFLIEWHDDAEKEEKLNYACPSLEEVIVTLKALTIYHEYLSGIGKVTSSYIYNVKIYNHRREIYDDWEDPATGINDPLELWEYLHGKL